MVEWIISSREKKESRIVVWWSEWTPSPWKWRGAILYDNVNKKRKIMHGRIRERLAHWRRARRNPWANRFYLRSAKEKKNRENCPKIRAKKSNLCVSQGGIAGEVPMGTWPRRHRPAALSDIARYLGTFYGSGHLLWDFFFFFFFFTPYSVLTPY